MCVCVCVKSSSHTILLGEMLSNCVRGARDRWRETKASGHLTPETTSGHLRVVEKSEGVTGEGVRKGQEEKGMLKRGWQDRLS